MNTWWVRVDRHSYHLSQAVRFYPMKGAPWSARSVLGELYRHHKGWRVVPWRGDGKGVNLPDMPLKEAKRLAKLLLPEE
jgi:hypothetical protein